MSPQFTEIMEEKRPTASPLTLLVEKIFSYAFHSKGIICSLFCGGKYVTWHSWQAFLARFLHCKHHQLSFSWGRTSVSSKKGHCVVEHCLDKRPSLFVSLICWMGNSPLGQAGSYYRDKLLSLLSNTRNIVKLHPLAQNVRELSPCESKCVNVWLENA